MIRNLLITLLLVFLIGSCVIASPSLITHYNEVTKTINKATVNIWILQRYN